MESTDIQWGGYSQINCEFLLLKAALPQGYAYYHLLSGIDLPLVSNDEFYRFFEENEGKNYFRTVLLQGEASQPYLNRIKYYRIFQDGRLPRTLKKIFNKAFVLCQKPFVNRLKKLPFDVYMGDNWFSITHELAAYIVSQEKVTHKHFKHSFCGDELFGATLAMSSPYKDSVAGVSLRYIDWEAGGAHPRTFTMQDYERIMDSGCLFARKFSLTVDAEVVERIYTAVKTANEGIEKE